MLLKNDNLSMLIPEKAAKENNSKYRFKTKNISN